MGIFKPTFLEGDGTTDRTLRKIYLTITDGTNASTLAVTANGTSIGWNGDSISEVDNVAKGATTGSFTLNAGGNQLTIEVAALTGNLVTVLVTNLLSNASATALLAYGVVSGGDIVISFTNAATGGAEDLTTLVDTGNIALEVIYITDE